MHFRLVHYPAVIFCIRYRLLNFYCVILTSLFGNDCDFEYKMQLQFKHLHQRTI